jgi:hypothetical protein
VTANVLTISSSGVHFHAATMLAWMALTIAQPILIHRRRFELHRQLGTGA